MTKIMISDLTSRLEQVIEIVTDNITKQRETNDKAKQNEFDYIAYIRSHLARYDHHQGTKIENDALKSRYQRETAIIHVITCVLNVTSQTHANVPIEWPARYPANLYSWYCLPPEAIKLSEELADFLIQAKVTSITVIDLCDQMLSRSAERYIGEFYTPPSIVEHLIRVSKFKPVDLLSGKHVVDPACGGGMILASLMEQVISFGLKNGYPIEHILTALSQYMHGFDIQPFAVTLARTVLLSIIRPHLQSSGEANIHLLENIELIDPLLERQRFWVSPYFSYVIGNPPFMSVKRASLDFAEAYDEVIYGHPNLYVLFLWWSVKASQQDGIISLLLPQSILIGNYFQRIRQALNETTTLLDITRMIDRKGVVGDADQQMMTLCLKVGQDRESSHITLRATRNGMDIKQAIFTLEPQEKVVRKFGSTIFWVVSENTLDYEIEEILRSTSTNLGELDSDFQLGNGGYVWNQNKSLITSESTRDSIPLVSAASISMFDFEFPYVGSHSSSNRSFSQIDSKLNTIIRTKPSILVQRTTPRKVGRRLVAAMLDEVFVQKYPKYFLENHVNYILSPHDTTDDLYGLLGWLNSDLINFMFQLRNGTTQVSIFELKLLPVQADLLSTIAPYSKDIMATFEPDARMKKFETLNEYIYEVFELTPQHSERIQDVLKRKEKHK